jgi:hypothetical protein
MFGGDSTGLVFSGYVENDVMIGSAFLPLDYDRAARVLKGMYDADKAPVSPPQLGEG